MLLEPDGFRLPDAVPDSTRVGGVPQTAVLRPDAVRRPPVHVRLYLVDHSHPVRRHLWPSLTPLAAEPGVRPFDITGRPMRGWILVAGEALDDDALDGWVERARTFVATLPPK